MLALLFVFVPSYCLVLVNCQSVYSNVTEFNVTESQVFVFKVTPDLLKWNEEEQQNELHFITQTKDGPDLPPWIFVKYHFHLNNSFFIFGAPPKVRDSNDLEIRLSVTSLRTYRTKYCKLTITILPQKDDIKYEIFVRINANIEDMFDLEQPKALMKIFENNFWEESREKTVITFLASSDDVGFRLPVNPKETTGVVLRFGSSVEFSPQLMDLQNETIPLSTNCPSAYKSVTVERFFKPKFSVDWCYFKLVNHSDCTSSKIPLIVEKYPISVETCGFPFNNKSDSLLKDNAEVLIDRNQLPKSEIFRMLILLVFIPSMLLAFGIVSWLASFMCLHHTQLHDPLSDDYFETVFFICEDCRGLPRETGEEMYREELQNQPALFSF